MIFILELSKMKAKENKYAGSKKKFKISKNVKSYIVIVSEKNKNYKYSDEIDKKELYHWQI